MDDLLQLAADAGVHVIWRDLGRRRGEYRDQHRLITLNPRMSTVLQRSTLAHELGHHHHGDTWVDDAAVLAAHERRATAFAAHLLITPSAYARAEALVGPHAGAIARELEVSRYIVDAWQTLRLRQVPTQRRSA